MFSFSNIFFLLLYIYIYILELSMLSYQKAMPKVKLLCKKHNIPYVQENVFIRLKKTIDSMVGKTTMREIPLEWEEKLNAVK